MRVIKLSILFLIVAFLMSSCFSLHHGNLSSDGIESNMTYQGTAAGEAETLIILGFGGTGKNALVQDAKKDMELNRILNPNERYINYTIDFKTSFFFGVVITQKVTVHADVVIINQENDDPMSEVFRKNFFLQHEEDKLRSFIFFKESEDILFADGSTGAISKLEGDKAIVYKYIDNAYKKISISVYEMFSDNIDRYRSVQLGDSLSLPETVGEKDAMGEVVGFGINSILVKYGKSKYTTVDY